MRLKDHAAVAGLMDELLGAFPDSWQAPHLAAQFLALSAGLAAEDTARADAYAGRAVEQLRRSVTMNAGRAGWAGFTASLRTAKAFDPLRGRPDFQQVLDQVAAAAPPPNGAGPQRP